MLCATPGLPATQARWGPKTPCCTNFRSLCPAGLVGKGSKDTAGLGNAETISKWLKRFHSPRLSLQPPGCHPHTCEGGKLVLFPKPLSNFSVLVSTPCLPSSQISLLCHCCLPPSEALLQQHGFSCALNSCSELFSLAPKLLEVFHSEFVISDFHQGGGITLLPMARDPRVSSCCLFWVGDCWV